MIVEDYWNYCDRCSQEIDPKDFSTPGCNCITEVEEWSEKQFKEEWENLPSHIRDYFKPPK